MENLIMIIAVYNGSAGGTQNTLVYANRILDIEVIRIGGWNTLTFPFKEVLVGTGASSISEMVGLYNDCHEYTRFGYVNDLVIVYMLPLYMEGIASADTVSFVEEHLENCTICHAEVDSLKTPNNLEKAASDMPDRA